MPISHEEFEAGRADLTLPILKLLEDNKERAYTAEEVSGLLTQKLKKVFSIQEVIQTLEELVKSEYVEAKEIAGQRWYAIIEKRIGFK